MEFCNEVLWISVGWMDLVIFSEFSLFPNEKRTSYFQLFPHYPPQNFFYTLIIAQSA